MKVFNFLPAGLLLLLAINANAQLDSFNLSDYKLPDLERRTLELDFDLSGSNSSRKTTVPGEVENSIKSNQYYSNGGVQYSYYLSNAQYQKERYGWLGIDYQFDNYKQNEHEQRISNISPSLYYKSLNRKYYQANRFFEVGVFFNYKYRRFKGSLNEGIDFHMDEELQSHQLEAYLPLKFGIGRIEQVQDARHAIYLYQELSKINRVSGDKSGDEIIDLARHISQLKNKRFFDSRLRRIYELESVDTFLIDRGYLLKSDSRYFATLADFWDYGNRPIRKAGTRLSFSLTPGYYYYNNDKSGDDFISTVGYMRKTYMLSGGLEFKREKPVSLKWQNSFEAIASGGIVQSTLNPQEVDVNTDIRVPYLNLNFSQKFGYYPNTRTDLSFSYFFQYIQLFDPSGDPNATEGYAAKGLGTGTNISLNYYFSPQFRLTAQSSLAYVWKESDDGVLLNIDGNEMTRYLMNDIHPNSYNYNSYNELLHQFQIRLIYSFF